MSGPKVSVVIPSYNHAAFIAQAVESVLHQSEADLELIVVDDGSQDESLEVLARFSDPRLRVISQENQGAHAAINRGLALARGQFLAILNSDDLYHPNRLEILIRELENDADISLAGSFIEVIDDAGNLLGIKHGYRDLEPWLLERPHLSFRAGDDLRAALLTENYFATTSNFVMRREWFERIGEFRPLRYTHDWDFALRASALSRLALVPEPLLFYRIHAHNTIREDLATMVFEICWCLAVHLPTHVADTKWFSQLPENRRVEQLLHSIYTFGCDRVLSVMLAQNLADNLQRALQLLEPDNCARQAYLAYIREHVQTNSPTRNWPLFTFTRVQNWLRRQIARWLIRPPTIPLLFRQQHR